jgi:transcriptional regulator with XRE-family HTH domain
MGYGGLQDDDAVKLLNLSESTLARIKRGARELKPDEAEKIAAACKLPVAFFDMDFWAAAAEAPADDVVSELRSRLEAVERQLETAGLEKIATDLEALQRAVRERP